MSSPSAGSASVTAQREAPSRSADRDCRLDFWRGLCLVDMVIVHLIYAGISFGPIANPLFHDYVRFAAGGFVFIAGLSVGAIFLPRTYDPTKRWRTYVALWRRAGVVLIVHYLAEISFLIMWPLLGGVPADGVRWRVLDILALRAGYDLLPFYVIMIALSPSMLEVVRRGHGWALAILSVGFFAFGQFGNNAWLLTPPNGKAFLPVLWQIFYVFGMLAGSLLPQYDRRSRAMKLAALGACLAWFLVLFASCYAHDLRIPPIIFMTFTKLPLNTGEALRYFSMIGTIMVGTDLIWRRWLQRSAVAGFFERLGRNSLPVYVFHVWVVQVLAKMNHTGKAGPEGAIKLWMAVAAIGVTWLFAVGLESWNRWRKERAKARTPRTPSWMDWSGFRVAATATAVLSLVVIANAAVRAFGVRGRMVDRPAGQIDLAVPLDYDPWDDNPDPVTDPAEKRRLHEQPAGESPA